MSRKSAC